MKRRLFEHYEKKGKTETFAGKYHCYHLIYYEHFVSINEAIKREKELKGGGPKKERDFDKNNKSKNGFYPIGLNKIFLSQ